MRHLPRASMGLMSTAVLLAVCAANVQAAEVEGHSGGWGLNTRSGSASWVWFTNPTAATQIKWTSGANEADATPFGPHPTVSEAKFAPGPPLAGKTFKPFAHTDNGPKGSTSDTSGSGSSTVTPGTLWGTNYSASWLITATGELGPGPGAVNWKSKMEGVDPFAITSQMLDDADAGPTFDLFVSAGLSGHYSANGGIGLDVSYETNDGTSNLLSIWLDATGAAVSNDSLSNLTIYHLASADEGPTLNPSEIVTLSDIQTLLNADIALDHSLDTPLYLGFVLTDVPRPTVELADGAVANIYNGVTAVDADAAVPEPGGWAMTIAGFAMLGGALRRRRYATS
jgi:hypothetical protein